MLLSTHSPLSRAQHCLRPQLSGPVVASHLCRAAAKVILHPSHLSRGLCMWGDCVCGCLCLWLVLFSPSGAGFCFMILTTQRCISMCPPLSVCMPVCPCVLRVCMRVKKCVYCGGSDERDVITKLFPTADRLRAYFIVTGFQVSLR